PTHAHDGAGLVEDLDLELDQPDPVGVVVVEIALEQRAGTRRAPRGPLDAKAGVALAVEGLRGPGRRRRGGGEDQGYGGDDGAKPGTREHARVSGHGPVGYQTRAKSGAVRSLAL